MAIEDHDAEYEPESGHVGNETGWIRADDVYETALYR